MVIKASVQVEIQQTLLADVPNSDDVVEYTLRCVLAMAPQLSEAIRQSIQRAASAKVREMFGGDRVYISRRAGEGTSQRNAQIKADYWQRGERIPLLERRYGLKKTQLWEIIKS